MATLHSLYFHLGELYGSTLWLGLVPSWVVIHCIPEPLRVVIWEVDHPSFVAVSTVCEKYCGCPGPVFVMSCSPGSSPGKSSLIRHNKHRTRTATLFFTHSGYSYKGRVVYFPYYYTQRFRYTMDNHPAWYQS